MSAILASSNCLPVELHLAILRALALDLVPPVAGDAAVGARDVLSFDGGGRVTVGAWSELQRKEEESKDAERRAEAQKTLKRCAEVCWAWRELTTPLLYTNIFLPYPGTQLYPLLSTLRSTSSATLAPLVHSLTLLTPRTPHHTSPAIRRLPTDFLHLLESVPLPNLTHLDLPPSLNLISTLSPFAPPLPTLPDGHTRLWTALSLLAPQLVSLRGVCLRRSSGHGGGSRGSTRHLNSFLSKCGKLEDLVIRVETPYSAWVEDRLALPVLPPRRRLRRLEVNYASEGKGGDGAGGEGPRNNLQPVLSALDAGRLERVEVLVLRGLDARREAREWVVGDGGVRMEVGVERLMSWAGMKEGRELNFEDIRMDDDGEGEKAGSEQVVAVWVERFWIGAA